MTRLYERAMWRAVLTGFGLLATACADELRPLEAPCGPPPSATCVARASGPCDPLIPLDQVCDGLVWRCPEGSEARAPETPEAVCRPYASGRPHVLGPVLPLGGRCLMLVDADVTAGADPSAYRAAVLPELPRFGACPQDDLQSGPFVHLDGLPADVFADVNDVAFGPRGVFAVHRLARRDLTLPFGVEVLGAAVSRVGEAGLEVSADLGFEGHGYRSLALDGTGLHMFDAFGLPDLLLEDVGVLRASVDRALDPDAYRWLQTNGQFGISRFARQVVFEVGPQHHVAFWPGLERWVMVSVAGFGDTVFMATAPSPAGPWTDPEDLHRCHLPSDDPDAFCDSARLVPALADPGAPRQLVLTYRVDTLASDQAEREAARPQDYQPVMVWLAR